MVSHRDQYSLRVGSPLICSPTVDIFEYSVFIFRMTVMMRNKDHNHQVIAYCALTTGFNLISQAFNFYYVNVFLNIYQVQEAWFQFAQVMFLIWNAINDPLFAYCADNKNIRFMSTRRNMVLYGAPFFALSFLVPWFQWSPNPTIIGLHLIIALCFWDTMFTLVGLASCCLFTEISQDPSKRITLTRYATLGSLVGSSSILFLDHASSSLINFRAFQFVSVIVAFLSWVLMHYCGKHCHTRFDLNQMKQKNKSPDQVLHERSGHESYFQQTLQILSDINFLSFVITNFFQEFHKTYLINFLAVICDQMVPANYISQRMRSTFYGCVPFSSQVPKHYDDTIICHISHKLKSEVSFFIFVCQESVYLTDISYFASFQETID